MNADYRITPVKPKDSIRFQCLRCGDCCRTIKDSVMLEPLDVYRLGRHLRAKGEPIEGMEDVLNRYAHPSLLNGGFPIFLLNTTEPEDDCVFLRDGGCAVYAARPRVCRLYPFTVAPGTRGKDFEYFLCTERTHHFSGGSVSVKDWLCVNFPQEDRVFLRADFDGVAAFGRLLRGIEQDAQRRTLFPFLLFRYYDYDLDQPFLPQYFSNLESLKQVLAKEDA